ncbi:BrnT family toxin [Terracidiphilus gabretensis]|uniref:BrnT family toxin n=1 Tax=Terracidiphilus gabretensis TaxID=1577687 RepID=UPI000A7BC0E8|nr:BrnT family toxin [Terracidiphilus gabretensis]
MQPQKIVWDPIKAQNNRDKHGIDFEEAATVFLDPLLIVIPDMAHSQEEERWIALGKSVNQLLLLVVHTDDDQTIRIISARKAEPKERRQYEQST